MDSSRTSLEETAVWLEEAWKGKTGADAAEGAQALQEVVDRQSREIEALRREVEYLRTRTAAEPAEAARASCATASPRSPAGAPDPSAKPGAKRVLIVDDDESILNLLEILIRRDGFEIVTAMSGEEALAKLEDRPDAVVLDLMLPGASSGVDVLRALRRRPETPPPVIVITALSQSPDVEEVKKDPNVALFLPKPINQAKLLSALHRLLNTQPAPRPR